MIQIGHRNYIFQKNRKSGRSPSFLPVAAGIILVFLFFTLGCEESRKSAQNNGIGGLFAPPDYSMDAREVGAYRKDAIRVVQQSLGDLNGIMRANSIETVRDTNLRELMPLVTSRLKDESVPVRFAAAVAVGDMQYIAAKFDLKEMLNDSNANVRIAAAYALSRIERPDYADMIRKVVTSDNMTLRANAVLLLGKLGDTRDLRLIRWALHNQDSGDKVKLAAIEAVARLGDERIYERIWSLLISKHPDDRVIGIRAMGALKTIQSRDAIITMLDDEVWMVRLVAAEQLGRMGYQTGEAIVAQYLDKEYGKGRELPIVDGMAILAVGHIGSERLSGYLVKALSHEIPAIQLRAAHGIILIGR